MSTQTTEQATARRFLRRNIGREVWIAYGTGDVEIVGYVISVGKHTAQVQSKDTGEIRDLALYAVTEAVER